jgi:uncharacterized protein involved in response to NO
MARIASGPAPALLHLAAGLWLLAFGLFTLAFLPVLSRPRLHAA